MLLDIRKYSVGKRLELLRVSRGLLQREVGEHVGVASQTIGSYERDERSPNDKIKVKLAKFFNTDVQTLFYYE